jgi:hypothetical protein
MTQDARIKDLEEMIDSLATAVESIVAAVLIADRDAAASRQLLKDAGALSSAIRRTIEETAPPRADA